jgi:hypothetical protein
MRNVFAQAVICGFVLHVCSMSALAETTDWQVLFDGTSMAQWRSYGESSPAKEWQIIGNTLTLVLDKSTDKHRDRTLISKETYTDFELELEWQISSGGNSGIFYRVQELQGENNAYKTGIEMQVLDNQLHDNGKNPLTQAGAVYGLYAPYKNAVKRVGEFNEVRIISKDNQVEQWLNGVLVVKFEVGSADWNRRLKNSKFAEWPHFAVHQTGHIALQDHSDRVSFRNIRIRRL